MSILLDFDEADSPMEGTKYQRYNRSQAGKDRRTKYRHTRSKWETDSAYLSKPFIAWDGEGIEEDGEQRYALLANSVGDSIVSREGLSSTDVFSLLLDTKKRHPGAIHIGYGLG